MLNDYKIEHVPVLKDYRHPTNPVNSKKEVRFYYHHKYVALVTDYKTKHGIKPCVKTKDFPLCLRSFRVFLAYNNLWWLVKKEHLTTHELETLHQLHIPVYM